MALVRWQPFRSPFSDLDELHREFDRFFDRGIPGKNWLQGFTESPWAPALDVLEHENEVVVKAELPGIDQEDINLSIVDNTLTLSGEKKHETESNEEGHYRRERVFGSFQRSINLPAYVDADKVTATYKEGVLDIRLPKREEAKTKKIKIKLG